MLGLIFTNQQDGIHSVLKNSSNIYCYRRSDSLFWHLNTRYTPGDRSACAWISTENGQLPLGSLVWHASGRGSVVLLVTLL